MSIMVDSNVGSFGCDGKLYYSGFELYVEWAPDLLEPSSMS